MIFQYILLILLILVLLQLNHSHVVIRNQQFEQQLEAYRTKLRDVESQRQQDDGDWSKEVTSIIEREKETNQRLV